MRLDKYDIKIIKSVILEYISDARIFLFGSRVLDNKRGGDIDLFVVTNQPVKYDDELEILTELELKGISRKVDLIVKSPEKNERPIWKTAMKTGVAL